MKPFGGAALCLGMCRRWFGADCNFAFTDGLDPPVDSQQVDLDLEPGVAGERCACSFSRNGKRMGTCNDELPTGLCVASMALDAAPI